MKRNVEFMKVSSNRELSNFEYLKKETTYKHNSKGCLFVDLLSLKNNLKKLGKRDSTLFLGCYLQRNESYINTINVYKIQL